jgi:CBS domain-containing protein
MKVREVMSIAPAAVRTDTPFKDIIALLSEHAVSGLPVVDDNQRVLGVVTTADLLFKEHRPDRAVVHSPSARASVGRAERDRRVSGSVAGELMSTPAITIDADADLRVGARLLSRHGIARVPVTRSGRLVGILSRSDVLKAFTRSDEELRAQVLEVLHKAVTADTSNVHVHVLDGVVRLSGNVEFVSTKQTINFHVDRIDGVTRVENVLTCSIDDIAPRQRELVPKAGPLSDID